VVIKFALIQGSSSRSFSNWCCGSTNADSRARQRDRPAGQSGLHLRQRLYPQIDRTTVHTKNALGFRGPDPPADFASRLTITIGGSTTEGLFLSDGRTDRRDRWRLEPEFPACGSAMPESTGATFGHLILLKSFIVAVPGGGGDTTIRVNDPKSDAHRFEITTPPAHGTAKVRGDGAVRVCADPTAAPGDDELTVTITDTRHAGIGMNA
jgi:hypothetical protein